jgi:nucleotide-binding universal stress UspA family protein
MDRERRTERDGHAGWPAPTGGPNRRSVNGAGRRSGAAGPSEREAEEVHLTLAPPCRYRSLLVPLNGEPLGEHALPLALGIARRAGAEVRVVHVRTPLDLAYGPELFPRDEGLDARLRRQQQAYLEDVVRRVAMISSVRVTPILVEGRSVIEALCETASAGTDLVVMATHGRGALGRLWFGSVADVLRRRLAVPLLLVRGYDAPADLAADPAVRHVLLPLDGSERAEQVLEPALTLGTLTGADHTLLRVVTPQPDYARGYGGPVTMRPPSGQAEAWDYLRRVADRLGGQSLRAHPCVVVDGQAAARVILRYARAHEVDLIALATRGRGGLARLLRGSVAERVVRGASVPVLVVRPEAEREGSESR